MRKILIANIFGIGDVLFTTPLIASIREAFPGAEVDYLCNARTKDLIACVPGTGETFVYEKDDLVKAWKRSKIAAVKQVWRMFAAIKKNRYDAVFDLTRSRRFSFFFMLAGIKKRIGLDYKNRGTFLTDKIKIEGFLDKHVAEYYLGLLEKAGITRPVRKMELIPPPELKTWAEGYLRSRGIDRGKLVAVIPGGGASWSRHSYRKRWLPEGFASAVKALSGSGWQVIVLGDVSEADICREIEQMTGKRDVFTENGLDLKKYIALLSMCKLTLCNDGGPLHMAVALGVKTVSIFGPVDPLVYGPYPGSANHRVVVSAGILCRPCYKRFRLPRCVNENRCIVDIEPEKVVDACLELLGGNDKKR